MNLVTKLGLAVLVAAGLFGAGYFAHKPQVVTQTKIQAVEKVVTKVVKEKVTKADGTSTETETTETTSNSQTVTKDDQSGKPVAPLLAYRPRYSLALMWTARWEQDAYKPTGAEFGYRLGETNAWGTLGYDWRDRSVLMGMRVEF